MIAEVAFEVGDQYVYENRKNGVRHKGVVVRVEEDGRVVGMPTSYWPALDLLIEVFRERSGKRVNVYRW